MKFPISDGGYPLWYVASRKCAYALGGSAYSVDDIGRTVLEYLDYVDTFATTIINIIDSRYLALLGDRE